MIKYFQQNMNNLQVFQGHNEAIRDASWAPNDERFVTGADDGVIKVWNFERMKEERVLTGALSATSSCSAPRSLRPLPELRLIAWNLCRSRLGRQVRQVAPDKRPACVRLKGQPHQVLGPANGQCPLDSVRALSLGSQRLPQRFLLLRGPLDSLVRTRSG